MKPSFRVTVPNVFFRFLPCRSLSNSPSYCYCAMAAMASVPAVQYKHPFEIGDAVERICEYAGPGHWLYLAGISTLCKQLYSRVEDQTIDGYNANNELVQIQCTAQMTLSRAMFASGSCFEWACYDGIESSVPRLLQSAGLYAHDAGTLQAARQFGLPMGERVLIGAVLSGLPLKLRSISIACIHIDV
jgi:hypothetical protein